MCLEKQTKKHFICFQDEVQVMNILEKKGRTNFEEKRYFRRQRLFFHSESSNSKLNLPFTVPVDLRSVRVPGPEFVRLSGNNGAEAAAIT